MISAGTKSTLTPKAGGQPLIHAWISRTMEKERGGNGKSPFFVSNEDRKESSTWIATALVYQ